MTTIDLTPLKQAALLKSLPDSSRVLCPYELNGECRDKDCENLHLSPIVASEPDGASHFALTQVAYRFIPFSISIRPAAYWHTDEEVAQYLCAAIPGGSRFGVDAFRKALDVARLSQPSLQLDDRVQQALSRLGLR